ncbi:uncharacterized protein LOC110603285 [Manihot esculenta]|uniref:DUF3511 domain-containing protein n=2 Tax=Manihot esculenta TaxID=3983 RepID=A0A251IZ93_MANES|nr:uncharacterized protein LOC110603285 [Manihot esculenta]KAG8635948.1 hypothetical protein MANES_16G082200v8 [Manihot esculenta]OAY26878.1 hypothetical protein MANES_16G082200v8 [Manihot esculenta]OAY26879.1 hypothetical protein MANES_16G082200v8 [Manihot esculenta]
MDDYNRSRSYSYSYGSTAMQMESYYGPPRPPTTTTSYDLRSYSASYAQTQMANNNYTAKDFKLKKGKKNSGYSSSSSSSKSWSLADPEFQRKKRVASYKMYSVEGKVKGSFRRSFRWLKDSFTQVVYGWW